MKKATTPIWLAALLAAAAAHAEELPQKRCESTDLKKCADAEWSKACPSKEEGKCKGTLEPGYKKHLEHAKKRKQFKAGDKRRDPKDLVDGYYTEEPAKADTDKYPPDSFLAFREADREAALAYTGDPASFSAHPGWLSDGKHVEGCEEYVYKSFLDWSRFEDRIFACKHDVDCEVDVAMKELAHQKLNDSDGKVLPPPSKPHGDDPFDLLKGAYPKNSFFATALPVLEADGSDPMAKILTGVPAANLAELRQILAGGAGYWGIATTGKKDVKESFADEWAFHAALRERNAQVEDALSDELDRRSAAIEDALARARLHGLDDANGDDDDERDDPRRSLGSDPFERMATLAGGAKITLDKGWRADPQNPARFDCTPQTTALSVTLRGKTHKAAGVDECRAWNLLLDEYDRLKRGAGGCLDLKSFACDWTPQRFVDRWVTPHHYIHERTRLWNQCQRFSAYAKPIKAEEQRNLTTFAGALERGQKELRSWRKLPTIDDKRPLSFGRDWHGEAQKGQKGKFAAGYEYDAGWELAPIASIDSGNDAGRVCQLEARAWAGFSAKAYLLGGGFKIVDAAAWIVANAWSQKDPDGSHKVEHAAHVTVLGFQLFDPVPKNAGWYRPHERDKRENAATTEVNQVIRKLDNANGGAHSHEDTLIAATFFLGPVPVTITAGAGVHYGAKLEPKVHAAPGCKIPLKDFGADLTFKPWIAADAFVTGGVGVTWANVSLKADVTLLKLGVPLTTHLGATDKGAKASLELDVGIEGTMSTLGGKLSVLFQIFVFHEEITFFRWAGLGPYKFEIVPKIKDRYELGELDQYIVDACKQVPGSPDPLCAKQRRH